MKNGHSFIVSAASLVALLAGCASPLPVPSVPEALKLPSNQVVTYQVPATGVQIYECSPSNARPGSFEWVFKGPEADLFDTAGKKIGSTITSPSRVTCSLYLADNDVHKRLLAQRKQGL